MITSVMKEYGLSWLINRFVYSLKIKSLNLFSFTEKFYEKKVQYPLRIDLFEIDGGSIKNHIRKLPNDLKETLLTRADNAIEGKLFAFSSMELDYGSPINWQLNPLTGKECEITKKWYQIPDFDAERGDIKLVWEASRFSHFITFARAYCLTEDIKYYDAFKNQLHNWLDANPYTYGANYKCGQECSLRMANALLAYAVFSSLGQTDNQLVLDLRKLVYDSYKKILSNFFYAYKCIKNDHTFSELMGMLIGAWCCDDDKRIKWANVKLNEIICRQFTKDGGYKSFSLNYEREIFQDIECVLSAKDKLGISLSEESCDRLRQAVELVYQCQSEAGYVPNYGSNDGALVFPVSSCEFKNYKPVLNSIYAQLTGKQLYEAGIHQEELIWFAGRKKITDYPGINLERVSSHYPAAGIYTIRTTDAWSMVVLNEYRTRPAHMDQLHFDLWINDINVFCDAGTYSYADKKGKKFADNEQHNTIKLQDKSQMKTYGAFMVYDWTRRGNYSFGKDFFTGEMISKNRYLHKRDIKYADGIFHIKDRVSGDKYHNFTILFHTPCDVKQHGNKYVLSWKGQPLCEIWSSRDTTVEKSWRSLSYLSLENINCICIKGTIDDQTISTDIKILRGETAE